mmetsp:Transcript_11733/g.30610  ORF Transcript_11733/g.30610 Transcript_11733/m.30610 type:complete len:85 (+) Transcript_11733:1690-1944(+)
MQDGVQFMLPIIKALSLMAMQPKSGAAEVPAQPALAAPIASAVGVAAAPSQQPGDVLSDVMATGDTAEAQATSESPAKEPESLI